MGAAGLPFPIPKATFRQEQSLWTSVFHRSNPCERLFFTGPHILARASLAQWLEQWSLRPLLCIAGARFLLGAFCQTWRLNLGGRGWKQTCPSDGTRALCVSLDADAFCWKEWPRAASWCSARLRACPYTWASFWHRSRRRSTYKKYVPSCRFCLGPTTFLSSTIFSTASLHATLCGSVCVCVFVSLWLFPLLPGSVLLVCCCSLVSW